MTKLLRTILLFSVAAGACTTTRHLQTFYVSPFNGNANDYHALPARNDSAHTAVYAGFCHYNGTANVHRNDNVSATRFSLYVAQHRGYFQWYCGGDLTLGNYTMNSWDTSNPIFSYLVLLPPARSEQLDRYLGPHFFAGTGFDAGINAVVPMGQGEWRVLGVETALHNEFGEFLHLRQKLPDSLAGYIVRRPFFGTVGLTSEFVFRTRLGNFGFRLAEGKVLGGNYANTGVLDSTDLKPLRYLSYTNLNFQMTWDRFTFYSQLEFAAKGYSGRLGFIYRFGKPRVPAKIYYPPPYRPLPPRPRLPFNL